VSKGAGKTSADPEIEAIGVVHDTLQGLDAAAQQRVLDYVARKLLLRPPAGAPEPPRYSAEDPSALPAKAHTALQEGAASDNLEGVSPIAMKWMKRNGLTAAAISKLFSLGGDEIDLVAQTVRGKSKRDRMHSVLLLKGVASYLSTGAARFTHEQVKEACLHYDAYDSTNFARYMRAFAPEVSGSKDSGYTLTARGLAAATDLIKEIATATTE
jgi:hypothetical protein